ncbi:MAG: hypothetical protein Q8910_00600 [Bacteroidota bacterium]|nr:hypothetical protein [Bacteroidota bacterium]
MYESVESEELHFLKVFKQVLIDKGFVTQDDFKNAERHLHEQRIQFIEEANQMINDFIKEYKDV